MLDVQRLSARASQVVRTIEARGFRVSVFHNPGSLLGTMPAHVEMHAVDDATDPPQFHMARVFVSDYTDPAHACASELANSVSA